MNELSNYVFWFANVFPYVQKPLSNEAITSHFLHNVILIGYIMRFHGNRNSKVSFSTGQSPWLSLIVITSFFEDRSLPLLCKKITRGRNLDVLKAD